MPKVSSGHQLNIPVYLSFLCLIISNAHNFLAAITTKGEEGRREGEVEEANDEICSSCMGDGTALQKSERANSSSST